MVRRYKKLALESLSCARYTRWNPWHCQRQNHGLDAYVLFFVGSFGECDNILFDFFFGIFINAQLVLHLFLGPAPIDADDCTHCNNDTCYQDRKSTRLNSSHA